MRQTTTRSILVVIAIAGLTIFTTNQRAQATGGYVAAIEALNPTDYWQLNETSGTSAADSGSNGYTLTYGAGLTIGQTGPQTSNGFAGFGATNYAPVANVNDNSSAVVKDTNTAHTPYGTGSALSFTLIAWVNAGSTSPSQGRALVGWGNIDGSQGAAFGYNEVDSSSLDLSPIGSNNYGRSDDYSGGTLLPSDTWNMLTVTYNNASPTGDPGNGTTRGSTGAFQFYVNGVREDLGDWNYGNPFYPDIETGSGNDVITIFSERGGQSGSQVAGELIDEVSFFSSALTSDQISGLYTAALTPFSEEGPSGVPEPSTFVLAAVGLFGLGLVAWRKRRARG